MSTTQVQSLFTKKPYRDIIIFTDTEGDDCVAIFLMLQLLLKNDEKIFYNVHIVVDDCNSNFEGIKILCALFDSGLHGKDSLHGKESHFSNVSVTFYRGMDSKPGMPDDCYGLALPEFATTQYVEGCSYWEYVIARLLAERPCFLFVLKPPLEILKVMSQYTSEESISAYPPMYKEHTAVWYGSFNLRSLYFDKKAEISDVERALHMFGENYLYETVFAVGENNTVSNDADSLGKTFTEFPLAILKSIHGWNKFISTDCIDTINKEVSPAVSAQLVANGYDYTKLEDQSEINYRVKRNCKPLISIVNREGNQFVNADTGAVMSVLMPQYYRNGDYTASKDNHYYTKSNFETAENSKWTNKLHIFYAEEKDRESVRLAQLELIKKAICSFQGSAETKKE